VPRKSLSIEQILTILANTPPRLAALTTGLTPGQLRTPPSPGEWSANDVLAHLRACADVWGGCIQTILSQDSPTIRAVNPRTWIKDTDYLVQAFMPSLQAFSSQRAELLSVLERLQPEEWSREAMVSGAGKPLTRSARFYAQWLARHERPHLKQIESIANSIRKG
jgi:hypothetical protein